MCFFVAQVIVFDFPSSIHEYIHQVGLLSAFANWLFVLVKIKGLHCGLLLSFRLAAVLGWAHKELQSRSSTNQAKVHDQMFAYCSVYTHCMHVWLNHSVLLTTALGLFLRLVEVLQPTGAVVPPEVLQSRHLQLQRERRALRWEERREGGKDNEDVNIQDQCVL